MFKITADHSLESMFQRAVVLYETGDKTRAMEAYKETLRFFPTNATCYFNLGVIYSDRGDQENALECYSQAVIYNADYLEAHFNLAAAYHELGLLEEALESYKRALELNPLDVHTLYNLGLAFKDANMLSEAGQCFNYILAMEPGNGRALSSLGLLSYLSGDKHRAIEYYRQAIADGDVPAVNGHLLAALSGKSTKKAPAEYVRNLFDDYAGSFESSLLTLGYRVPEILAEELQSLPVFNSVLHRAVDLGCGTGLSGLAIKPFVGNLTGVDLSVKMLEAAATKNIYDSLVHEDVVSYLQRSTTTFDLFIAADMIIYLGDLDTFFTAVAQRAHSGALLAFSTESCSNGEDFVLRETGRFAHAGTYIERLAAGYGFKILSKKNIQVRKDNSAWIKGGLYILRME